MRKTTDPREHKYLVDREFNTFGRGAVEDAPAELLYGHGAVSLGFNVNCHKQYFEGRGGSKLFSATRSDAWYGDTPILMAWHSLLEVWVRVIGGKLYYAAWDMAEGWTEASSLDGELSGRRASLIEERNGGVIYSEAGIFRWNFDEGVIYRIDHDKPFYMTTQQNGTSKKCVYRYLFTGVRLRNGNNRVKGGAVVDFETPTQSNDFTRNDVYYNDSDVGVGGVVNELEISKYKKDLPATITHIGVYRTLDLEAIDPGDPYKRKYNEPDRFALVGDFPVGRLSDSLYLTVTDAVIDDVSDAELNSRMKEWYPRTRFRKPLPPCNIAAAVPQFILCAVEGDGKLYYTDNNPALLYGGHLWGSYNPSQLNEQVKDNIHHIELFPDVVAIFGARSTWAFPTNVGEPIVNFDAGINYTALTLINLVDNIIGCAAWRTARHLTGGEIILVTKESDGAAVRVFNGHSYGENLIEDAALGQFRNKNKLRNVRGAIAVYNEQAGYVVWCSYGEDRDHGPRSASYCFRVAVRSSQGGGITEYGGEHWLWPDVDAAAVASGYDPDGNKVTLVEDAEAHKLYRIGLAEQWLDREGDSGREIPTRVALPTIADAYKWQKHLETHIAMRCWKPEYRGAAGYTPDGFRAGHKVDLKIYEDGEQVAEASALQDVNRNGDYAYLKKVEARRIQEVIETSTSCYKISQVTVKAQTSDREALPIDNVPVEADHQREWRDAVVHLSRNLPYARYNRADGEDIEVLSGGEVEVSTAPTGEHKAAFYVTTQLEKRLSSEARPPSEIVDFTVSSWIRFESGASHGALFTFTGDGGDGIGQRHIALMFNSAGELLLGYDGDVVLTCPITVGEWSHVVLRRAAGSWEYGSQEAVTVWVNGVQYGIEYTAGEVQNSMGGGSLWVGGSYDSGSAYQNTWEPTAGDRAIEPTGDQFLIGDGHGAGFFDVRLMLSAVSDESIITYYSAVCRDGPRGAEGWLP